MHGTGLYWNRQYKADLQTDEYAVFFFRLYDYYYPDMSDCYEPTAEPKDKYRVEVHRWRQDFHNKNHRVADHLSEHTQTPTITAAEANKIYWNLKHKNLAFETIQQYFASLADLERKTL